mgnify:CR=1 FL=1
MNELIDSNEFSETYETAMGIVTVWKKDGISTDGVKGKEALPVWFILVLNL